MEALCSHSVMWVQSKIGHRELSGHSIFLVIAIGSKVATGAKAEQSRVSGPSLGAVRRKMLSYHIGLGHVDSIQVLGKRGHEYDSGCIHICPVIFGFFAKVTSGLSLTLETIPVSSGGSLFIGEDPMSKGCC